MNRVKPIFVGLAWTIAIYLTSRAESQYRVGTEAQINPTQVNTGLPTSLVEQGFTELKDGMSREAMRTFEQAKKKDPLNSLIRFGLARALQDQDQKIRALEEYTISIFLDPNNAKPYANRALIKGSLQDLAGALDDLETAIRIDRDLAPAYLNRGVTLAALNKPMLALEDFNQAIKIDPRYADAYRNRGITKNFLGDLRGACRDWKQAGSLGQAEPWAWYRQLCLVIPSTQPSVVPRHPSQR